jgi:hypothetical protein
VQWTHRPVVRAVVRIQLLGPREGGGEEDFVEAVGLLRVSFSIPICLTSVDGLSFLAELRWRWGCVN